MRNVLITGASRGIGAETARIFAKNGDRVFINYNRSENAARSLQSELSACGYDTVLAKADVSGSKEVNEMFENILHEYGGIDVLVNNAGISQIKLFTDITDDDWNTMLSVNLSGVFYCCRAALPYMIKKQHGRIINISSMWGHCKALMSIQDGDKQYSMALHMIEYGDTVREAEKKMKVRKNMKKKDEKYEAIYKDIEHTFQDFFGTKVKLDAGNRKGKIIIQYTSNDDLERILDLLK